MSDRPTWDQTWMSMAEVVALRARCDRAQVGAVIVSANNRIAATGYNGPAATFPTFASDTCISFCDRAKGLAPLDNMYDACPSIHAEANALLYVDRDAVEGGTIYVNRAMCMSCAKLVSNSGLERVVVTLTDGDAHRNPESVFQYLETCGLFVAVVDKRSVAHG